jgi:hypothetical protein
MPVIMNKDTADLLSFRHRQVGIFKIEVSGQDYRGKRRSGASGC